MIWGLLGMLSHGGIIIIGNQVTRERLDRAVANSAWRARFPLVRVINGDPRHSDHRPIIVEPGAKVKTQWKMPLEVMWKFEARWLEECGEGGGGVEKCH